MYAVPAAIGADAGSQPGTPLQEIVRDLFAEALDVPRSRVHADSDFFRAGGDAPAAARLLSRVRATLGADPGGRALDGAPTPAAFAALVGDGPVAVAGPLRAGTGTGSAVLPLRLRGPLNRRALEEALADLGGRHEALRNSRIGSAGTRLRTLSADDHLLDLALPATAVDLWSHLPLAAELARAYAARATGTAPHRSPAALDAAPRALFGDTAPTALPGATGVPGVPGGVTPSAHASYGTVDIDLDEQLHTRLAVFAAAHGATVFMVAHTALAALLTRRGAAGATGGRVTVAARVPARDSAEVRGAVGPYGRTLALSVNTSGEVTFGELLRRVRTADLAAYRDGASELAVPGGVALAVLQEPEGQFEAAGLTVRPEHSRLPLPDADLGITLTERQTPAGGWAGIRLRASFRYEAVEEAAAARLAEQFVAVLEEALDDPALTVGGRCALPAGDVAALFAAQVARTPRAPALPGMTYGELDAGAGLLAQALTGHRAGPGTSVVTALSSPAAFAVAALAVARTGATLLPVDPSQELPGQLRPAVLLLDGTADRLLAAVPGAARLVRDDDPAAGPVQGYPDTDTALGLFDTLLPGARTRRPDASDAGSASGHISVRPDPSP
ncbi:condensation domain-containing protein [Streptomyces beijiangensis]|uniref:AMP-binding protein n=1 Tax=Streptomyces beijiangensis TaxID=163361 RepID=A0A939FE27_9ACTN|nr:condensation domain-containing protein [Streptomyces beijiangensis]MBO0516399.1 AMP-binding protein [Streptomyces beijiangensis]